jgi:hypothetical protein
VAEIADAPTAARFPHVVPLAVNEKVTRPGPVAVNVQVKKSELPLPRLPTLAGTGPTGADTRPIGVARMVAETGDTGTPPVFVTLSTTVNRCPTQMTGWTDPRTVSAPGVKMSVMPVPLAIRTVAPQVNPDAVAVNTTCPAKVAR